MDERNSSWPKMPDWPENEPSEKSFAKNIILTKNAGSGKYDSWS
jgi:hypothetical protein